MCIRLIINCSYITKATSKAFERCIYVLEKTDMHIRYGLQIVAICTKGVPYSNQI